MCDAIRHRGPDDEGFHVDRNCAIGMRRLSIIDLSTGHQPISNEDGSLWIVFNGEVYNYRELREDLIRRGHRFRTNSDTETILHLHEEEGVAGIGKLRGMFAYAIWDARDRSLLLVRDRFGKKPLYIAKDSFGLYFGSELKCMRAAGVPLDVNREAIQLYLQFSYIPEPKSAYQGISKLPAGSWERHYADGRTERGRYWQLPAPVEEPAAGFTQAEACEQLRKVFDESVRMRMIADVPLGAFLSGGLDSSSIVASMARQSREPVKTFSIGFEEATYNELPYAAMVAKQYGTDHHEIVVHPDSAALLEKVTRFSDEPFGDEACIPTYIVSEFAAQHVKVVLTGDGGDELFAGYESFFAIERMRWADRIPRPLRSALAAFAEALPYSAYGKNFAWAVSRPSALDRYFEMNSAPHFLRRRLLDPAWAPPADTAWLRQTFRDCLLPEGSDVLSQAIYFEATAKLTGDMLVKVDRMSMANSLEVRCPLLDHELAALAFKIPHRWKLQNGHGKHIFVEALGNRLPSELLHRQKMGFSFPLSVWFRGELRTLLWDHLTGRAFTDRGIASPEFVRHLLAEHDSGRRDNSHWLYMLLMLELWFRDMDASPSETRAGLEAPAWQPS
jgi:asparagine synthase (glutamine-hydrolysing)